MSEELLIRHCSPTLAGMKTGNLFVCSFADRAGMRDCVRCWNRLLTKKGLRILPLRFRNGRALIYVYRPSRLSADLQNGTAKQLLQERGYCTDTSDGYPPEDVCGFIENRADGCKCVGCWKVYGDAEAAQKIFAKYKKCSDIYAAQFANGRSIERLTVAG